MTYTTDIRNTNELGFGAYKLLERDGQVIIATEYNTPVVYTDEAGHILRVQTARSLLRFKQAQAQAKFYEKTAVIRHYTGLTRLLRTFA